MTSFNDIHIKKYSDRSVVVRGDTRIYKEDLKKLGGKYNGRLRDGPGWIFPMDKKPDIQNFIDEGVRLVTKEEATAGEKRTLKKEKESEYKTKTYEKSSSRPSLEYKVLTQKIDDMASKIDKLEKYLKILVEREKGSIETTIVVSDTDSDTEEEFEKPKRLLRR